MVLDPVDPGC